MSRPVPHLLARSERPVDRDHRALFAAREPGATLCTIVGIEGSFSRRLGAQLTVRVDGSVVGDLSDGCLEAELVRASREVRLRGKVEVRRYGRGGGVVDFRLPCGAGIDIAIDPRPDPLALAMVADGLARRKPALLSIGEGSFETRARRYIPQLRIIALGSGPEVEALASLGRTLGHEVICVQPHGKGDLSLALGEIPAIEPDAYAAVAMLFHDHEWERALLPWALMSEAFRVVAIGGEATRAARFPLVDPLPLSDERVSQVLEPAGLIGHARDPDVLALSLLATIVADYERLRG